MSIFDDKKYESLDWISQATEPIECAFMAALSKIPDEITIDFETYMQNMANSYDCGIDGRNMMIHVFEKYADHKLSWSEGHIFSDAFKFEVSSGAELNLKTRTLTGAIKFIKVPVETTEQEVMKALTDMAMSELQNVYHYRVDAPRCTEILEILGVPKIPNSPKAKVALIKTTVKTILQQDKWRIRSDKLYIKMARWIAEYIKDGDLSALSNFCRLKLMTHKGVGIYSIEEVL